MRKNRDNNHYNDRSNNDRKEYDDDNEYEYIEDEYDDEFSYEDDEDEYQEEREVEDDRYDDSMYDDDDEFIKDEYEDEDIDFDDEESLASYLSESVAEVSDDEFPDEELMNPKKKMSKKKKTVIIAASIVGVLLVLVLGIGARLLSRINLEKESDVKQAETDLSPEELAAQETLPPRSDEMSKLDEKVVNILLIGEEAMGQGGGDGRSDSMMIASINTEQKKLKLVSLMRDCYVTIPGYRNNKLNAAFSNGGGPLLSKTILQNFGIKIDGYVKVNFEGFVKLIDRLGGVEISLTETEARYLNTTNYIKKKQYRNVKVGMQTLNGYQALGYCRVRHREASNGEHYDFGRTYRQRTVINAVFDKYKSMSVVDMVAILDELLPNVTTNISHTDLVSYATAALTMGVGELENMRVPIDGGYTNGNPGGIGDSLILNEKNNTVLREFIYGDGVGDIYTITPDTSSTTAPTVPYTSSTKKPTTSYVTKKPTQYQKTEAPSMTDNPTKTTKPKVTKIPTATEVPVTDKPKATKEPPVTEPPVTTKAPVVTEAPKVTKEPVVTEPPVVHTDKPVVTEKPNTSEEKNNE